MMQLDSTFFLCDVEEQLEAARHLQKLKIPLRDMYKMSLAPVSNSMAVLKEVGSSALVCVYTVWHLYFGGLIFCELLVL